MKEEFKVYREHKIPEVPGFLKNIFMDKDIVRRILFTLFIVIFTRIIFVIPAPGINVKEMMLFFDSLMARGAGSSFSMLSRSATGKISLFALGLMPYITSCILLQIIGALYGPLKKKYFRGEKGRRKIAGYTYIMTLFFCLLQSFFLSLWLENPANFGMIDITSISGWPFRIVIMLSLTCGTFFLLWLANLITERGIGNGIGVLIATAILSIVPYYINRILYLLSKETLHWNFLLLKGFVYAGLFVFIVFITNSFVKIPVTYKETINKKVEYLYLRFSMLGKMPLSIAAAILILPLTALGCLPQNTIFQRISLILSPGSWTYIILYSILIMFFTYVYMAVVFKPKHVIRELKKYNAVIKDVNIEEWGKYLDTVASRVCRITGISLIVAAVIPSIISNMFQLPGPIYIVYGTLGTMVVIGVFYDIIRQLKAINRMRRYPGAEGQEWRIVYRAFDEIEADIRKGYIVNNNIPCVVESLRFTWGLPIRTAVDQHRLYVPLPQFENAIMKFEGSKKGER